MLLLKLCSTTHNIMINTAILMAPIRTINKPGQTYHVNQPDSCTLLLWSLQLLKFTRRDTRHQLEMFVKVTLVVEPHLKCYFRYGPFL